MPVRSGCHAGEEGVAPGRAALLGVVVHELRAFIADAIDVGRLADHQAAMVDARLHPADVVAHDEEDVGLLCRLFALPPACWPARTATSTSMAPSKRGAGSLMPTRRLAWRRCNKGRLVGQYGTQHGYALLFMMHQRLLA